MSQPMMARIAALPAVLRAGVVLCAGAVGGFAQEPYGISSAILFSMIMGVLLCASATTTRAALWVGWLFGTGYFLVSLTWIIEPFLVDVARHGWMAPFALVFLAAGLALFWAGAFGLARWLGSPWGLALSWPMAELARAYIFTGFPWAMPPQALIDTMAGQALAWVGPHGVMLGLSAAACAIALPVVRFKSAQLAFTVGTIALVSFGPSLRPPEMTGHVVRLVQPNAPQHEKWDPEKIPVFVNRLLDSTAAAGEVDLVIWPETALPYLAHQAAPVLEAASERARGVPVVLGIQRREDNAYFNALLVLGPKGEIAQTYDKHHLVPFGEYLPFSQLMHRMGLRGLAENFGGGYRAGEGAQLLDMGALGSALPLICYEAVFAQDVAAAPERPAFLMQITNDAWFGKGKGPMQHLAQARMRAIEQGLPMARAANTGISAMIGPRGQVLQALALNEAGFIDAGLPAPLPATLYARTGDPVWMFLIIMGLVATAFHKRLSIRSTTR